MDVAISSLEGATVITVGAKSLTAANVETIRPGVSEAISAQGGRSVLDLGPVEYMDSSGAGLLVAVHKTVSRCGGQIRLAGLTGQPLSLVRMVNLDRILPLSRDVAEALDALGGSRKDPSAEPGSADWKVLQGIERVMGRLGVLCESQFGEVPPGAMTQIREALEAAFLRDAEGSFGERPVPPRDARALTVARLAESLSHRLGGSLALIHQRVQFLKASAAEETLRGSLDVMERACSRGGEELRRFKAFATGAGGGGPERISFRRILDEAMDDARSSWEARRTGGTRPVRVMREFAGHPEVLADPSRLKLAIEEILVNASEAMADGGVLSLSLTQGSAGAVLSISDTGPGIREEHRSKLFEPGFSTKGVPGAGLGLSLAKHVICGCGGDLTIESEGGRGTTVRITLPNIAGMKLDMAAPLGKPKGS